MFPSSPSAYSLGADTAPVPVSLFNESEASPARSQPTVVVHQKSMLEERPLGLPDFPPLFREWPVSPPRQTPGLDDELGPAAAVSKMVPGMPPDQVETALSANRAGSESIPLLPVLPVAKAGNPPSATATATREELAALQEVLFDVALAVTKRNGELAGLEERLAGARAVTEEASRLEAQVVSQQAELERAGQLKTALMAEIGQVQEELDRLTWRGQELTKTISDLEAGVDRLQSDSGALEGHIGARTIELEQLEHLKSQQIEAGAELASRMESLHADLAGLTEQTDLATAALNRVRNALCDAQLQFESLTREAEREQAQFAELSARRATLVLEQAEIEAAVDHKSQLLTALGERADDLSSNLSRTEAESRAKQEAAERRSLELEQSAKEATGRLEDAWRDLTLAQARQEELARESADLAAALQSLRAEQSPLQTEIQALKGACEIKSAELTRLDRELLQTRRDIHEAKIKADGQEAEAKARRVELEAGLATIEISHQKAQQAMAATQTRYEALLVKQDEALQQLDALQARRSGIAAEPGGSGVSLSALTTGAGHPDSPETTTVLEETEARLVALQRTTEELEAGLAGKTARQQALEEELRQAAEHLAGLRATAAEEEQRVTAHRRHMEEEIIATSRTLQQARDSLRNDPRQQDLSNRHSAALNELAATQSDVAGLKAEALELQNIIQQRQAQKEALLDEILRSRKTPAPPSYQNSGAPAPVEQKLTEPTWERIVSDLMRLVDATDTAHSHIVKSPTPEAANGQFTLLREAVTSTLQYLGVQEFVLPPGHLVDSSLRRQIQVVKTLNGDAKPWIQRMLSPGFVMDGANGQKTILRKPEVIVSSEPPPA